MEIKTIIDLSLLPYQMGDVITIGGKQHKVLGIHLYIGNGGGINSVRYHIGYGKFITIKLK